MIDNDQQLYRFSATARLLGLLSSLTEEQFISLLQRTVGDGFVQHLFKMVLQLPDDQQRALLKELEGKMLENGKVDRRGYPRKPCLISVTYTVQDRRYKGFILDISAFGVFIETKDFFSVGQETAMQFSIPTHPRSFELTGEIVWSGTQGFGVKFTYLTQKQLRIIKAFSEKMEEVYEIIS
jgi:Tfp pilus assembly protein PilZ